MQEKVKSQMSKACGVLSKLKQYTHTICIKSCL